ncbi:RES family NAD+ phosphorylase [Sediminicola luteus]|uniref:Restriction endonuclease subunit R n=1 Tax=Sediminicola luteus TaxID=319238 RepID=A0A2A4G8B5_9FLAO|nr:RES family NAD+ phosphorylase [Sediminicola luteus]PCE64673.1 restriction endonuclease subunit R [Sediminicola luteus]
MVVYRITNAKYKEAILSGVGAELYGGRWNMTGTRAVYCSQHVSLALLEYYIHAENIALLPKEILVAEIVIPDNLNIHKLQVLPKQWNTYPYSPNSARVFTEMVVHDAILGLQVPSAIVGLESNIILNPLHKDFGKVSVKAFHNLPIDPRPREK